MLLVVRGAALLLSFSPPAARHVIHAAFDRQARGKQLVSASDPFLLFFVFVCFVSCFHVACILMNLNFGKLQFSQCPRSFYGNSAIINIFASLMNRNM